MAGRIATVAAAVSAAAFLRLGLEIRRFQSSLAVGRRLARSARRFERRTPGVRPRILVVGDSTAVGTGADMPSESVAGRLAAGLGAVDLWNLGRNGLRTAQLRGRLASCRRQSFDLVILQTGANDIVRFTPLGQLGTDLTSALELAQRLAPHVLLLTGGNLGLSPAWPTGVGRLIEHRTRLVRELFIEVAAAFGAHYVDMFDGRIDRPFVDDPLKYYAADGFHPNSAGYGLWCDAVLATMRRAGINLEPPRTGTSAFTPDPPALPSS